MKIALIGTVAQSAIGFRKDMILALKEKNHDVFVFCTDFTNDSKKRIENLGAVAVDYSLNRAGLNPFKDFLIMKNNQSNQGIKNNKPPLARV